MSAFFTIVRGAVSNRVKGGKGRRRIGRAVSPAYGKPCTKICLYLPADDLDVLRRLATERAMSLSRLMVAATLALDVRRDLP